MGVTTTQGTVLKNFKSRKIEKHWLRGNNISILFCWVLNLISASCATVSLWIHNHSQQKEASLIKTESKICIHKQIFWRPFFYYATLNNINKSHATTYELPQLWHFARVCSICNGFPLEESISNPILKWSPLIGHCYKSGHTLPGMLVLIRTGFIAG